MKKKALAVWGEEELSSSDESQDDEVANICFTANLKDEVTSQPPNSIFDFKFEKLHDAFNDLLSECEHINEKNIDLKRKLSSLENEVNGLKTEKEILKYERNRLIVEKGSLLKENKDMKKSLEKLVEGKKN